MYKTTTCICKLDHSFGQYVLLTYNVQTRTGKSFETVTLNQTVKIIFK